MSFALPQIDENINGWGPTDKSLSILQNVPSYYTSYNKGEKLGKIADLQGQGHQTKQGRNFSHGQRDQQTNSLFTYSVQDDDSSFTVVKNPKTSSVKKTPFRRGGSYARMGQTGQRAPVQNRSRTAKKTFRGSSRGRWGATENITTRKKEYSVEIKPDWALKESIEFSTLNKLADLDSEPQGEILQKFGEIKYYDTSNDRITTSTRKPLKPTNAVFYNPSTADDSVMRDLSKKENVGTVFAIDSILSHLMTCTRSVVPWDIIITKVGSKLFFDIREESNFDRYVVSETSTDSPSEDSLSKEATSANQSFTQQILNKGEEGIGLEGKDPFALEGEERPHVGYFYKRWDLGDDIKLVSRCEINGAFKNEKKYFIAKALFEYDPKITGDWRKKIDTQRSSILTSEMKTNPFKLSKWTAQASLASSTLKLGFISRAAWRDIHNHVILSIQDYEPKEIATQISFNLKQSWAILKHIIRICNKYESGKYVLLRDNEKSVLRLYSVPADTFEVKDETKE